MKLAHVHRPFTAKVGPGPTPHPSTAPAVIQHGAARGFASSLSGVWTSAWQIRKLFPQFPQSVYVLYMLELAGRSFEV